MAGTLDGPAGGTPASAQSTGGTGTGAEQSSTAENAKEQAQQAAQGMAGKVQDAARQQVGERSTQAGERVSSISSDLRSVSEQLRTQENETGAKLADQAAEQAERAGSYLADSDADKILSDIEDLGRRQPWLALVGGVALGVAAARFMKASSSERYSQRSAGSGNGQTQIGAPATESVSETPAVPATAQPQQIPVSEPATAPMPTGSPVTG